MTTILYKIKSDVGQCEKIHANDAVTVRIQIDGADDGAVSVGGVSARLKRGVARLSLSTLPDGDYTPLLHRDSETVPIEGIRKWAGRITLAENDPNMKRQQRMRLDSIESKLSELEERVLRLEEISAPHTLFK